MNKMDKICQLLNLNFFEKFNIVQEQPDTLRTAIDGKIRNPYYFTDEGLINNCDQLDNHKLADLITGIYKIEPYDSKEDDTMIRWNKLENDVNNMPASKESTVLILLKNPHHGVGIDNGKTCDISYRRRDDIFIGILRDYPLEDVEAWAVIDS